MVEIYGHRGAKAVRPENTLSGFRYAFENGISHVEMDVHLSADDEVMVIHDPYISAKTYAGSPSLVGAQRNWVREMRSADLQNCRERSLAAQGGGSPEESIPRFEDLLALQGDYPELQIHWGVEIKYQDHWARHYPRRQKIVDGVFRLLEKYDVIQRTTIFCFDAEILRLSKLCNARVKINYLYAGEPRWGRIGRYLNWVAADWSKALSEVQSLGAEVFAPSYELLKFFPQWRQILPAGGQRPFKLIPWTVNGVHAWRQCLDDFAVDGIITDDPVGLRDSGLIVATSKSQSDTRETCS